MKIALISINSHTKVLNPASPLHTYVFQQFLLDNGIESTIIDYKPCYFNDSDVRHELFRVIDKPYKDPKKQKYELKKWKTLFYDRESRYDKFEAFIKSRYIQTEKCYNQWILDEEDPGFDCYICVTDIIWKYNSKSGFDRGFFLACKCMEGKKKIAYSPSRGAKGYTDEQENEFIKYIADFDFLSARETSLKDYIKDCIGIDVPLILDPVFLKEKDFYHNLAVRPDEKDPYILCYVVMQKAKDLVMATADFARAKNMKVLMLSENIEEIKLMGDDVDCRLVYDLGVEEWLGYMENAAYIFTNSFHVCVLSLIMHKQFFVGSRDGDKIDSLLDAFNVTHRRISIEENGPAIDMPDMDFVETDGLIKKGVEKSSAFILNAIHELENRPHIPLASDMEGLLEERGLKKKKTAEMAEKEAEENNIQAKMDKEMPPSIEQKKSLFSRIISRIKSKT